jgi:hypothetical protein
MSVSRRVFLSFLGLAAVFSTRFARVAAAAEIAGANDDRLVVLHGWVLRADDLDHLGPR